MVNRTVAPGFSLYVMRNAPGLMSADAVQRCIRDYARLRGLAGIDTKIERTERGKPYFPNAQSVHFSVSHSGTIWICAFSDRPIGIDIQRHTPIDFMPIARRFFHSQEIAALTDAPDAARFFDIWTAKEAYLKFTGQGLTDGLKFFSVVRGKSLRGSVEGARLHCIKYANRYSLSIISAPPDGEFLSKIR